MSTQTTYYNLTKPALTDPVDVTVLDDNFDIIDSTLYAKLDAEKVGAANGVAALDGAGKVPSTQLPSYVDDVVEAYYYNGAFYSDSAHTTPITPETGIIYVDLHADDTYRWSGSVYVRINDMTVDDEMSAVSTNPVQNRVVYANLLKAFPTDTASGAVANFPDGADGLPVKSLMVNIEPVQSGSGDPSPTNIRPISGWTGCNISHSGEDTSDPTVIPISWQTEAGTVYGGTLDVTTGNLTGKFVSRIFDGSETWTKVSSGDSTFFRFVDDRVKTASGLFSACSHFANERITTSNTVIGFYAYTASGAPNVTYLQIRPGIVAITTASEWADWIAEQYTNGTPLTCVWESVEQTTYQLTPAEVKTLLGTNNIWADCGPVEVEYRADPTLYISKINTPSDDDMTADTQIASGKYFIIGNNLYLSTTTIPAGDTIIPGTNCTKTNLAEALNALNA